MARLFTALLLIALTACSRSDEARLASGESFSWQALEGQWVVVNYWAEWCKPCYEEIPDLNELDRDPRVRVLGVNYDGLTGRELQQVVERMDIRFSTLVDDPSQRFDWPQPVGLPATFVISPDGELVEARFGIQTREELLALIESR